MKYIFRKLWPLILVLALAVSVLLYGSFAELSNSFFSKLYIKGYPFFSAYCTFAVYVICAGAVCGIVGAMIPRKFDPDRGIFSCGVWEKAGRVYEKKFRIKKWKDKLFDLSKAFEKLEKKTLSDMSELFEKTERLVQETCVAELTHWVLIIVSPLMFVFRRNIWMVILWMAYVVSNLMDIMIQRYNRPRLLKILNKRDRNESNNIQL